MDFGTFAVTTDTSDNYLEGMTKFRVSMEGSKFFRLDSAMLHNVDIPKDIFCCEEPAEDLARSWDCGRPSPVSINLETMLNNSENMLLESPSKCLMDAMETGTTCAISSIMNNELFDSLSSFKMNMSNQELDDLMMNPIECQRGLKDTYIAGFGGILNARAGENVNMLTNMSMISNTNMQSNDNVLSNIITPPQSCEVSPAHETVTDAAFQGIDLEKLLDYAPSLMHHHFHQSTGYSPLLSSIPCGARYTSACKKCASGSPCSKVVPGGCAKVGTGACATDPAVPGQSPASPTDSASDKEPNMSLLKVNKIQPGGNNGLQGILKFTGTIQPNVKRLQSGPKGKIQPGGKRVAKGKMLPEVQLVQAGVQGRIQFSGKHMPGMENGKLHPEKQPVKCVSQGKSLPEFQLCQGVPKSRIQSRGKRVPDVPTGYMQHVVKRLQSVPKGKAGVNCLQISKSELVLQQCSTKLGRVNNAVPVVVDSDYYSPKCFSAPAGENVPKDASTVKQSKNVNSSGTTNAQQEIFSNLVHEVKQNIDMTNEPRNELLEAMLQFIVSGDAVTALQGSPSPVDTVHLIDSNAPLPDDVFSHQLSSMGMCCDIKPFTSKLNKFDSEDSAFDFMVDPEMVQPVLRRGDIHDDHNYTFKVSAAAAAAKKVVAPLIAPAPPPAPVVRQKRAYVRRKGVVPPPPPPPPRPTRNVAGLRSVASGRVQKVTLKPGAQRTSSGMLIHCPVVQSRRGVATPRPVPCYGAGGRVANSNNANGVLPNANAVYAKPPLTGKKRGRKPKTPSAVMLVTATTTRAPAKRKTAIDDPQKRLEHNEMERSRREDIKKCFDRLSLKIPEIREKPRNSKITILRTGKDYVSSLFGNFSNVNSNTTSLKIKRFSLENRITFLTCSSHRRRKMRPIRFV